MAKRMETPNYIKNLLKPTANKATSRKVWSIDLETVWLPFFTATNAMGDTAIPHEAIGAKSGDGPVGNRGRQALFRLLLCPVERNFTPYSSTCSQPY